MKKRDKLILLLLIIFVFILSSCSVECSETMQIDENFEGNRSIKIDIDKNNERFIKGGLKGLKNFLEENVEDPLNLEIISDTNQKFEAKISLVFDSLDDYTKKVKYLYELSSLEEEPKTKFKSNKDNIFSKGLDYYDDVTSEKLLKYLIDRAVSTGLISKNNQHKILKEGNFKLIYKDKKLIDKAKAPYSYNNFEYLGPSQCILSTSPAGSNTWTRVFSLVFPIENLEKLDTNWESKLIKNEDIKALETKDVKDKNGRSSKLFSFVLEKKDSEILSEESSIFLQANVDLDLSIEKNTKDFSIDYFINEELKGFEKHDDISITNIYYTRPLEYNKHIDLSNFTESNLTKIKDAIVINKDDLIEGYHERKKIQPKFKKADIKTTFNKDGIYEKEIKITKGDDFYANMASDLISKYLSEYNIQATDDSKIITIRYSDKDFQKKNLLFFDKNPKVSVNNSGLLGYSIEYEDMSKLNKFSVDEINQSFVGPNLSNIKEKRVNYENNSFDNQVIITGTSVFNIIILVVFIIFLIVVGIKGYKHWTYKGKKNSTSNDDKNETEISQEKDKDFPKYNKEDTQPIEIINNLDVIDKEKMEDNDD